VVEHLYQHCMVEGWNTTTAVGTGRQNGQNSLRLEKGSSTLV
jgi:hypothetical protein